MILRWFDPKRQRYLEAVVQVQVGGDQTDPEYSASEIGDVDSTTVEVTFSEEVNSSGGFDAGVTIRVNAVSQTISSATKQADPTVVHYVITPKIDINDSVTWEYDSGLGDIEDTSGNPLGDVAAQAVTNYVGSHFYFDEQEDSAHIAHL